jgi:hypothetical protein
MLLDKFSRVIGETTPESVRCRGGRDSIDHGPGSHDDVANAVAGVLLRNVGNPLDAESLAAPWQDAPETPGRFETVYRRPRNLDHEFSGWADEKTVSGATTTPVDLTGLRRTAIRLRGALGTVQPMPTAATRRDCARASR